MDANDPNGQCLGQLRIVVCADGSPCGTRAVDFVVKGESMLATPGPALDRMSEGSSALPVGTRGHRELTGFPVGSVSEHVLHHASRTTIVVS